MATVLVCATPLAGHVGPLTGVGRVLAERGHDVIVVTGSHFADQVTGARLTHHPLSGIADFDERDPDSFTPDRHRHRGLALSRYQIERTFIAPVPDQAAAVDAVMTHRDVDAILCDGMFAGIIPLLSRSRDRRPPVIGIGTMPLAQTSADVAPFNSGLPPMGGPLGRMRNRLAHLLARYVLFASTQRYARTLVRRAGGTLDFSVLDISRAFDRFVQLGPAEFEFTRADLASNTVFAGPMPARGGPATVPPPWWAEMLADDRPVVHVTQGTLDNDDFSQLVEPAVTGLGELDVQVVVTTGGADPEPLARRANTRIARYLDYDALLPRTSVLVTNGGYGGVLQALRCGVPVIVAPGGEDKPEVASRVAHFGVGADLRTRRPSPLAVADAVRRVLADDEVKARARRMARAIADYDPAATLLAELDRVIPGFDRKRSPELRSDMSAPFGVPSPTTIEREPDMSDARAVIDTHIDAFNSRTPENEPWSVDAELVSPGGMFTGREAVLGFLAVFQGAFSDGRLTVESSVVDGDNASVEGTFAGVHDGVLQSPSGPIEPTGRAISFRWSATYRVNGSELSSEHLYFDQLDFLGQLGVLPG